MKKLILVGGALMLGLLNTGNLKAANTNAMLVQIQISGIIQQSSSVTNSGVATTTYTTKSAKLGNQDILNMLQVEFGTSFPAGAQLAYNLTGNNGFCVLDSNGNQILDASKNLADSGYRFELTNNVTGLGSPEITLGRSVETVSTGDLTETASALQSDYALLYEDSHNNNFHFTGLLTLKVNAAVVSSTTTYNTVSFSIAGQGGGKFFNPTDGLYDTAIFTKARITATGKGLIQ